MGEAAQDLEERFAEIGEIRDKVSQNQGEICVCFRELIPRPQENGGCFPMGTPDFYYFETGIISDELQKIDDKDNFRYKTMDVFDLSRHPRNDYFIIANYGIPVKQLFSKGGSAFVNLHFMPERLEEVKKGKIAFAAYEFPESRRLSSIIRCESSYPCISSIDFLFGEEDVRDYLVSHKNVDARGIDDFIQLITISGEVEKRFEEYELSKRQDFVDRFLMSVSELLGLDKRIAGIEDRVLNATCISGCGWINWGHDIGCVGKYEGLRRQAKGAIEVVGANINEAHKIGFTQLPFISLKSLGSSSQEKPQVYLENLIQNVLPPIYGRLARIDSHLATQKSGK